MISNYISVKSPLYYIGAVKKAVMQIISGIDL